jgi:hypothetical protein
MRWQLAGDWPVGGALIPAGTITDGTGLPMPMPINAVALDVDAALQMAMWYNEEDTINGWHHLHFAPGIDREAVMAQARHKKRWPNGEPSQTSERI